MPAPLQRGEQKRSLTWPPVGHILQDEPAVSRTKELNDRNNISRIEAPRVPFEDDLNDHPEDHFLSPVHVDEYEDWTDDSDDDAEDVEWDAGITDFALFDDDRRRAHESDQPLPSRWNDMLSQQASALRRAVERNRADADSGSADRLLSAVENDVPSLTPDVSPNLRDDLDMESYQHPTSSMPSLPRYLTITVTPPKEDEGNAMAAEDYEPVSFYVTEKQLRIQTNRRLERPGMRHSRTLSGRRHTWRRPGSSMYTVGEDPDAEARAEKCQNDDMLRDRAWKTDT